MRIVSTGEHVRSMRAQGIAKPRRRMPRQIPPKPIEREYGKALAALIKRIRGDFAPFFAELPSLMASARAGSVRGDSLRLDAGEGKRVRELIEQARARMAATVDVPALEALAAKFAQQTSTFQRIQLNRQTKAALGVDLFNNDNKLQSTLAAFVDSNVGLVKGLTDKTASDIEALTLQAVQDGKLHGDLAQDLEDRFSIGERKATLIARDQVGKLYGQANAIRQRDIGVAKFVWRTANDERVRPEHEMRDGETYSYDDPPDGELPGEPILCRCYAEPVLDDILNDVDANEIPTNSSSIHNEDQVREVDARSLNTRGYYEPEAGFQDGARLEKARAIIRDGQRDPVKMTIGKTGKLEVSDGRHRLQAAIELGAKVKVQFVKGTNVGTSPGLRKRGG